MKKPTGDGTLDAGCSVPEDRCGIDFGSASIEQPVSAIGHPSCNRLIVPFVSGFGHFIAIVPACLRQMLGVLPK
jgi:hypothetical protein